MGAQKAGTTSLHEYLKVIPKIFMSPVKEPDYFSTYTVPDDFAYMKDVIRNKHQYFDLFKNVKNEKIIGESSPTYLCDPQAPYLIHEKIPSAKILISLRDPVERAFSHYWMLYGRKHLDCTFRECIDSEINFGKHAGKDLGEVNFVLKNGLYAENVKRYLDIFGKNQIKIIFFEDLIRNTYEVVQNILDFLNIDSDLNFEPEPHNVIVKKDVRGSISQSILDNKKIVSLTSKIIPKSPRRLIKNKILIKTEKKPMMREDDRRILIDFFADDVEKTKTLLDKTPPWKNFKK